MNSIFFNILQIGLSECLHCTYIVVAKQQLERLQNIICDGKSQHLRQKCNIIRWLSSNGIITINFVKLKNNIANPITKGLTRS